MNSSTRLFAADTLALLYTAVRPPARHATCLNPARPTAVSVGDDAVRSASEKNQKGCGHETRKKVQKHTNQAETLHVEYLGNRRNSEYGTIRATRVNEIGWRQFRRSEALPGP